MATLGYKHLGLAAGAIIVAALYHDNPILQAVFANSALAWLGRVSYGVYILPQPVTGSSRSPMTAASRSCPAPPTSRSSSCAAPHLCCGGAATAISRSPFSNLAIAPAIAAAQSPQVRSHQPGSGYSLEPQAMAWPFPGRTKLMPVALRRRPSRPCR